MSVPKINLIQIDRSATAITLEQLMKLIKSHKAVPYRVRKNYPKIVFLDNFYLVFLEFQFFDDLPYRILSSHLDDKMDEDELDEDDDEELFDTLVTLSYVVLTIVSMFVGVSIVLRH